jgi:hypothetical protein
MTDNSSLLPNNHALTSDVLYNMKPSAARCRSYRASIPASNKSTFSPSDTIIAYIPARRNCFLDTNTSYIRFTVKNNDGTNSINVDGTCNSWFQRLDVYHGSNLLETIQEYGVLSAYLADFQLDYAKRYGLEPAMGCTANRQGSTIAVTGCTQTFTTPIVSGTVGCLNDKYLPLSLADDIRLEFTLQTALLANYWSTTATGLTAWSIIDFQLELNILELSDDAMRMVESVTPFTQPIYMHGSSYRHYSSTLANGSSGQQSFLVPARFASLKQLIMCPRRATEIGLQQAYSISSRVNPNIETYWWRVGSLIVPQKAITIKNGNNTGGYGEAFYEIIRAWQSAANFAITSALPYAYFNVADAVDATCNVVVPNTTTNSYKNGFAVAQEMESIANRNDTLLTGTNTLNSQIFFEWSNNAAVTAGYTLNFFAQYDHIICLDENGLLSVKF